MRHLLLLLPLLLAARLSPAADVTPGKHGRIETAAGSGIFYDLVVPPAYAADAEARFPVLFSQVTAKGASTFGHDAWAADEGVLLVAIHNNGNHGGGGGLDEVEMQDAVIAHLEKTVRVHPCLRFSTGVSASAARALIMAKRHPTTHAGVLLTAHSGNGNHAGLAKHIAVAFAHGRKDEVHPISSTESAIAALKSAGNPVRWYFHDGGHDGTDRNDRETGRRELRRLLTWMLWHQKLAHPHLPSGERATHAKALLARIAAPAPGQAAFLDALMDVDAVKGDQALHRAIVLAWGGAKRDAALAIAEPPARLWELNELLADPMIGRSPLAKELTAAIAPLAADPALKAEHAGFRAWRAALAREQAAGRTKARIVEAGKAYVALTQAYPGTIAATRAAAAAERIQAALPKQ